MHVSKSGLVVCAKGLVLGCSPDGTEVIYPNCEDAFGLLVVKCPEAKFHVTPLEDCVDPQFYVSMCIYYAQV